MPIPVPIYKALLNELKRLNLVLYLEVQDGAALRVVEGRGAVKEAEEERDYRGAGDDLEAVAPRKQSEIWEGE